MDAFFNVTGFSAAWFKWLVIVIFLVGSLALMSAMLIIQYKVNSQPQGGKGGFNPLYKIAIVMSALIIFFSVLWSDF